MDVLARASELLDRGETFCLATVVASSDPPVREGGKALVLRDGTWVGSLGSPQLERQLTEIATEALQRRKRRTVDLSGGLRVFLDVLSGEARLVVCGAGHIAVSLARLAREVGFKVTVLDDRPDFAHPARFPGCEVLAEDFVTALRAMPLGPTAHVVVVTRGHEHDSECLNEVLRKESAYVGLIGSRRRVRFVLELLGREGIPQERLEQVFTPIGLPIGAESPEEIALSIAAELVCVRRKGQVETRALRERPNGGDGTANGIT